MKRVTAHVPIAAAIASLLLFGSPLAASAAWDPDPNPNNNGHLYGWYKPGQKGAPTPAPSPSPSPNPTPQPKGGGASNPGTHPNPGAVKPTPGPSAKLIWTQLQDLPVLKLVPTGDASDVKVNFVTPNDAADPWWWLILLLPPTLAALLVIAIRGLVRRRPSTAHARTTQVAVPAGSPAL